MATIMKRMTKSSSNYRIQVKMKDKGSGKLNVYFTTWQTPAGLPHRTVHSLRHTNITMQIAAGVPLVTAAGGAGHARTSTTTDIYSHFLKSFDKTAAEKLEQLFE